LSSSLLQGYAALNSDFDSFYTRRLKTRLDDCFGKPVTGVPGRSIVTFDRTSDDSNLTFKYSGERTRCLNISSYNYLGFAAATGGCADAVEESIRRYGVSAGGPRLEAGTLDLHVQAEALVARFLGKDDAMVISMGFATNSTTLPAIVGKGCLVISDELNHSSIRFGTRLSGAAVRSFKHNDMGELEKLLREVISQGQPRTHRPWKKILVVVEGIYSMEGNLVDLPMLIELKAKYKVSLARLFLSFQLKMESGVLMLALMFFGLDRLLVLPLHRRGSLDRRTWTQRTRSLRLLWNPTFERRYPDGNAHQGFRSCRR